MSVTISNKVVSLKKLLKLYDVICHLYGPNSNHVIVHSKTVFASHDLFNSLNPECDVIKLMISYLKNQTMLYKDGGLFVAIVTIKMVERYTLMDASMSFVSDTIQQALTEIESLCNIVARKVDIGKLKDVSTVIKSILSSKHTFLKATDMEHLCLLFARVFTTYDPLQNCHVILHEDSCVEESQLYDDGLLLRLDKYFDGHRVRKRREKHTRVILYSVSLAVDSEELLSEGGKSVVNVESVENFKDAVLAALLEIGRALTPMVDLVICQKVIHPRLKILFKNNGIICVDRVGGNIMPLLEKTCCCQMNSSLSCRELDNFIGNVSSIDIVQCSGKSYLKLCSQISCNLKTLVLCSKNEHEVNALHRCYETSMIALTTLSRSGFITCGGGCTETQICMRLLHKLPQQSGSSKDVDPILFALLSVCMGVSEKSSALHHSVDNIFHHHWVNAETAMKCCCGAVRKHPDFQFISFLELLNSSSAIPFADTSGVNIYDSIGPPAIVHVKEIFMYNIRSAFELAGLVLRIGTKVLPT